MPLFAPLKVHSEITPYALALVDCGGPLETLSYRELVHLVDGLANLLSARGFTQHSRVRVRIRDNAIHVIAVLALDLIGVRQIICSQNNSAVQDHDRLITDMGTHELRANVTVIDMSTIRFLASNKEPTGVVEPGQIPVFEFNADRSGGPTHRVTATTLAARFPGRLLAKQNSRRQGWLCAADLRSELGLSCVLEILSVGLTVGLSSGAMGGDIQLAELYGLDALFLDPKTLATYSRDVTADTKLRYRPKRALVSGAPIPHEMIANTIGEFASDIVVSVDLPETGPLAVARFSSSRKDLRYSGIPPAALTVVSDSWEPRGIEEPGKLAVFLDAPTRSVADNDERIMDGWYMSSLAARLDTDHYIRMN